MATPMRTADEINDFCDNSPWQLLCMFLLNNPFLEFLVKANRHLLFHFRQIAVNRAFGCLEFAGQFIYFDGGVDPKQG